MSFVYLFQATSQESPTRSPRPSSSAARRLDAAIQFGRSLVPVWDPAMPREVSAQESVCFHASGAVRETRMMPGRCQEVPSCSMRQESGCRQAQFAVGNWRCPPEIRMRTMSSHTVPGDRQLASCSVTHDMSASTQAQIPVDDHRILLEARMPSASGLAVPGQHQMPTSTQAQMAVDNCRRPPEGRRPAVSSHVEPGDRQSASFCVTHDMSSSTQAQIPVEGHRIPLEARMPNVSSLAVRGQHQMPAPTRPQMRHPQESLMPPVSRQAVPGDQYVVPPCGARAVHQRIPDDALLDVLHAAEPDVLPGPVSKHFIYIHV